MNTAPKVWLTRSLEGNREWQPAFEAAGFHVANRPALRFELQHNRVDEVKKELELTDWLIFPSPRAVDAWVQLGLALPKGTHLACVGPRTAEACTRALHAPDLYAAVGGGEELAKLLLAWPNWQRALILGARDSRPELPELLRAAGREVRTGELYRTLPTADEGADPTPGDFVLFASPSAIHGGIDPSTWSGCRIISIGPTTTRAIRAAGLEVAAEAQ
ncbi:MAG: uroporphyrinogen-III synthase, partial [Planctomycetota bacterium]